MREYDFSQSIEFLGKLQCVSGIRTLLLLFRMLFRICDCNKVVKKTEILAERVDLAVRRSLRYEGMLWLDMG